MTTWVPLANDVKTEGESYVMYSGTDESNAEKIIQYGAHEGIYLTTDPSFASQYGEVIVKFLVPKNIKVSPSKQHDENLYDAELDIWGTHSIIAHNPYVITAVSFDNAEKVIEVHYYG